MKALSFVRPGAQSITQGTCRLINRHFEPGDLVGQYVAIHSSSNYSKDIERALRRKGYKCPDELTSETGIVGIAKIEKPVYESKSAWFDGPVGWPLSGIRVFRNPIQISGQPGVWDLPRHVVDMLKVSWKKSLPGVLETTTRKDLLGVPIPKMDETPVLAVNVQTTGCTRQDRIVAISLIEFYKERIVEELTTIVNPRCTIPESASKAHGITRKLAHKERSILAHKNQISKMFNRATYICGHDVYFTIKYLAKGVKTDLWNEYAVIIDTKKMLGKPLEKLTNEKYSDFVAKQKAMASYYVAMKYKKERVINNQISLSTLLDQASIWRGEKK